MTALSNLDVREVHDISPVETVEAFVEWMYKKACMEGDIIYGRIQGTVYGVDPYLALESNLILIRSELENS